MVILKVGEFRFEDPQLDLFFLFGKKSPYISIRTFWECPPDTRHIRASISRNITTKKGRPKSTQKAFFYANKRQVVGSGQGNTSRSTENKRTGAQGIYISRLGHSVKDLEKRTGT